MKKSVIQNLVSKIVGAGALVMLGLALTSCSDPPTSQSIGNPGTLIGFVEVSSPAGSTSDHSGTTVELEGTTLSTTTDATGRWVLNNVPAGIYTIRSSRNNCGYVRQIGFQFVGDDTAYVPSTSLDVNIQARITSLTIVPSVDSSSVFGYKVVLANNGDDFPHWIDVRVSTDSATIDGARIDGTAETLVIPAGQTERTEGHYYFRSYPSGTRLYAKAYFGRVSVTGYYDPNTRTVVTTGTPPPASAIATFVVP